MDMEIDELLEDEYAAQQEEVSHIHFVEVNGENDKQQEVEGAALLVDISETLRLLSEQMICLNEVTKQLPETLTVLQTTTKAVQCISNELPAMVREQCLEEYKKILANAVKNYNQMQRSAGKWQQTIGKDKNESFRWVMIFVIIIQNLLLLNLVLK